MKSKVKITLKKPVKFNVTLKKPVKANYKKVA